MSLFYKLIEKFNPMDKTQSKHYAVPVNDGKISIEDLTKDIVNASSLSRGDVINAIDNLIDVIPKYLLMGKSVNLGELGTLRISFSSEGLDANEEFRPSKIKRLKYVFTPSVSLKKQLRDAHFEHEGKGRKEWGAGGDGSNPGGEGGLE